MHLHIVYDIENLVVFGNEKTYRLIGAAQSKTLSGSSATSVDHVAGSGEESRMPTILYLGAFKLVRKYRVPLTSAINCYK